MNWGRLRGRFILRSGLEFTIKLRRALVKSKVSRTSKQLVDGRCHDFCAGQVETALGEVPVSGTRQNA